ncbi:hypothetical protein RMS29_027510 (plasmid) [Agrobacterium rosae]|uniref:Uncharacterized protein n=1 Tax=Agrobacterium rosae TaxID=1972867 RepID=A0AAW9FIE1_9HYPH|nr:MULTISPECIES: hypothetical protein [Agrobacterium]MCF1501579.1 hypothetical protein [Allorhizobium sp. Av2]MDX8321701.1 hypothetical protein [Agrobacterium sp. rho-8.1]MDX8305164.1 hypothetical protein [Agrobacterium rosae]MDX8311448.1 hypothetical protein [Agrobacterium sp. rho-13.3]MDX8316320.1 hypothetical protein [Agrobacterium rosae]
MADLSRRKKIYLGSSDPEEKADDIHLVRKLIRAVYEKGLERQLAGKPLPDSFMDLFGNDATVTSAVRAGDADAFRYASEGGAISNRERLLLEVLSGRAESKITSTEGIKESLLSNIFCISAVDNPVDLANKQKAEGGDDV